MVSVAWRSCTYHNVSPGEPVPAEWFLWLCPEVIFLEIAAEDLRRPRFLIATGPLAGDLSLRTWAFTPMFCMFAVQLRGPAFESSLSDINMRYLLDYVARLKYRVAYLMLRILWFVRRPATYSSGAALWYKGKILLVRPSYRPALSLPGGSVERGEPSDEAARRGLLRELGIGLAAGGLQLVWQGTLRIESRLDTTEIWEMCVQSPPRIWYDSREIIWAGWMAPSEALKKRLLPHVTVYLARTHGKDVGSIVHWSSGRRHPVLAQRIADFIRSAAVILFWVVLSSACIAGAIVASATIYSVGRLALEAIAAKAG